MQDIIRSFLSQARNPIEMIISQISMIDQATVQPVDDVIGLTEKDRLRRGEIKENADQNHVDGFMRDDGKRVVGNVIPQPIERYVNKMSHTAVCVYIVFAIRPAGGPFVPFTIAEKIWPTLVDFSSGQSFRRSKAQFAQSCILFDGYVE